MNAPIPQEVIDQNVFLTSYQIEPKHLDSASSYATPESTTTYAVYEPPLQYHYLKRPYVLEPKTLTRMPEVSYFDASGRALHFKASELAPGQQRQIAMSVFELKLQPGILFAPHPAFAKNEEGQLRYAHLSPESLSSIQTPYDFEHMGTRELVAEDYAYAIKRLASPRIVSPSFGFLSKKIIGFEAYGQRIKALNERMKDTLPQGVLKSQVTLPWLDFRALNFEGVEVLDRYTLRIKVKGVYPQFNYWLAMTFLAPVAWEVDAFYAQPGMAQKNLTADTWPVGTGPFMLTVHDPSAKLVLKRNPNYRGVPYPCEGQTGLTGEALQQELEYLKDCGKTTPFLDGIILLKEKEHTAMNTKFIQGYYDSPQIEKGEPGIEYQVYVQDDTGVSSELKSHHIKLPSTIQVGIWYFGFNWLDPVVGAGRNPEEAQRNRLLRQAISIAFDFQEYVQVFENNRAEINTSVVVPGLFGWDPHALNPTLHEMQKPGHPRKTLEEAKRLLALAGYPNGRDAKTGQPLVINYDAQGVGPGYKARFDWVTKQFAKLNIQLELRSTDFNRYQDKMLKGSAQFFLAGWLADYPDPENFLFLLYGPSGKAKFGGENSVNYSNPEYDRLFEMMKDMDNTPERLQIIRKMQAIMQDDAVLMFGWSDEYGGAFQPWVYNGKPSNIVRDHINYLRIDPLMRRAKIQEWNQAVLWPLACVPVFLALLVWPAWRVWYRRQNTRLNEAWSEPGVSPS
jgi:ABC-type transport system substrate-binding protein